MPSSTALSQQAREHDKQQARLHWAGNQDYQDVVSGESADRVILRSPNTLAYTIWERIQCVDDECECKPRLSAHRWTDGTPFAFYRQADAWEYLAHLDIDDPWSHHKKVLFDSSWEKARIQVERSLERQKAEVSA